MMDRHWIDELAEHTEHFSQLMTHADLPRLSRFIEASDWAKQLILVYPDRYLQDFYQGVWNKPVQFCQDQLQTLTRAENLTEFNQAIRVVRNCQLLHIGYRDINQLDPIEDVNRSLTELAENLCQITLMFAFQERARQDRIVISDASETYHPYILGMGKVGGRELNFSSDIDLIVGYRDDIAEKLWTGGDVIAFLHKVIQLLIAILESLTEDGFVYRVDLRLRPFGVSGPLLMSTSAMVNYYQQYGRDWERYALIKARPIAGNLDDGWLFLDTVNPFIYRQYIDYSMLDSLRTIKRMIEQEVTRRDNGDNIKLGEGGIREVEFIVQSFQLIYGGHDRQLQNSELLPVLDYLGQSERIPKDIVSGLNQAYLFLRTIENRLQMVNDEQTHTLPESSDERLRLAQAMMFSNWTDFCQALDQHRGVILEYSRGLFGALTYKDDDRYLTSFVQLLAKPREHHDFRVWLENEGVTDSNQKAHLLWFFHKHHYLTKENGDQKRLAMILLHAFRYLANRTSSTQTLNLFLEVLGTIAQKTPYLALLYEKHDALFRLLELCEHSPWVSRYLARYPVLLDELIHAAEIRPLSHRSLLKSLNIILSHSAKLTEEEVLNILRDFLHTQVLKVAMADLSDKMPLMIVSDHLSEIAEVLLGKILRMAWSDLSSRHGHPTSNLHPNGRPDFIIVSYGKLGGLELGYQSDLDLIFIHDSPDEEAYTDGSQSISNLDFFTKLTQRIIHYLNTQTTAGILYEIDTRLRPSGGSGLIVSSFQRFKNYQEQDAWVWEHQALIRARPITGSETLTNAFNQFRKKILGKKREIMPLKHEIIKMRNRLHKKHDNLNNTAEMLKYGNGGMIDIEFIVQYLVLAHAYHEPLLIKFTDNVRQLAALEALGRISSWDAMILRDTYREIRKCQHKMHLAENNELPLNYELEEKIKQVDVIYQKVFPA